MRDTINGLFGTIGLSLVAARLFIPAEAAHLGETLWIVQLWLLAAAVWLLLSLRHVGLAQRPDRADLAVWLLAAGHIVSALVVVATEGQKRAALNMAWEWAGIAVAVTMLRQWLRSEASWRRFYHLIAVAGVVLSGLGIWQFTAWYPSYRALLTELMSYEQTGAEVALSAEELARVRELREQLGIVGAEQDPVARAVLRQRLLASTEPIGRFALANTLGGVLAAALLLLSGMGQRIWTRGEGRTQLAIVGTAALLVGYCLVLTKSRTAWVGVLAACGLWGLLGARGKINARSALRLIATGALIVTLLAGIAWWSGALDRFVISETPKSLKYRLEYWTGAWGVIREAPLLGVGGTGNFRQHYLGHKLPGSSEEVLDPHNFVLDVWANGGIIGLAGLACVLWCFAARARQVRKVLSDEPSPTIPAEVGRRRGFRHGAAWIGVFAIVLLLVQEWALGAVVDTQLLWLLAGWIVAAWLVPSVTPPLTAILAAGTALMVHLLGAGGIAMPAISTLLLLLMLGPSAAGDTAGAAVDGRRQPAWSANSGYIARLALMSGAGIAAFLIPSISVSLARTYVAAGESVLSQRGDPTEARRYFQQAAEEDPLDPQPWHDLAQLDYAVSQQGGEVSNAAFQAAVTNLHRAIERDPFAPKLHWLGAQWCLERFRRTNESALVDDSLKFAETAVAAYPHESGIRATLAAAHAAAGNSEYAADSAARALELDDLNRQLGHYDRLLSDETVERLKAMVGASAGESAE